MKYEAGEKGLRLWDEAGEVEIVIEAVREDIIRVRQAREKVKDMPSFLVEENIREREKPEAVIREEEGKIFLGLKKLTAEVSADTGIITWRMSESGKKLLTENGRSLVEKPVYKYTTGEEAPVIDRVKTVDGERNFIKNLKKSAS